MHKKYIKRLVSETCELEYIPIIDSEEMKMLHTVTQAGLGEGATVPALSFTGMPMQKLLLFRL